MKTLILCASFILINTPVCTQNILEALALKDYVMGPYVKGETMATDTLIDLNNGYYEEFSPLAEDDRLSIRQAAIFDNFDGTKTLAISIANYDFVCFYYESYFYEITKTKDSISALMKEEILPVLSIDEFFADSSVFLVLNKYLPEIKENYLDSHATIDQVLSEVYDIKYIIPQRGTRLKATLSICDYIPLNEVSMDPDDWSIIENEFLTIELEYNRKQKKFEKRIQTK